MPELGEVEHARRIAERVAVGRVITEVVVLPDPLVFEGRTPDMLREALRGGLITGSERHGKHFWLTLRDRPSLLVHLGMSGTVRTPGEAPLPIESGPAVDPGVWPPRFLKLHLFLEDGGELAFTNARRFGRLRLRDDVRASPPVCELGYDPLEELPSAEDFSRRIGTRRGTLKGLLLDQGFAAGVGNWIADEVLYQTRLDPRRLVPSLSPEERDAIRLAIRHIVVTTCAANARAEAMPPEWLFHRRWGRPEGTLDAEGALIVVQTVAGRSTAFVPSRQR